MRCSYTMCDTNPLRVINNYSKLLYGTIQSSIHSSHYLPMQEAKGRELEGSLNWSLTAFYVLRPVVYNWLFTHLPRSKMTLLLLDFDHFPQNIDNSAPIQKRHLAPSHVSYMSRFSSILQKPLGQGSPLHLWASLLGASPPACKSQRPLLANWTARPLAALCHQSKTSANRKCQR